MASMADVYRALNALRDEGIVENYAIGGGMAALFYAETTRTYDIDVFVLLKSSGLLVSLSSIYRWAEARGFPADAEHLLIYGVPVQFLSAKAGLETEAIEKARTLDYDGVPVRVMPPEHLAIISVLAGGAKRRSRFSVLIEAGAIDKSVLTETLQRFDLVQEWQHKGGDLDE